MNTHLLWNKIRSRIFGYDARDHFHSDHYLRHNQRRLEHLASLGLLIVGKSVLELGAGIGDHTSFFVDRGCDVCSTDAREDCLNVLRRRFQKVESHRLDLDEPNVRLNRKFDIVYAYGVLYHLKNPAAALSFMADHCAGFLLLETCVSPGTDSSLNAVRENSRQPSQAVSAIGCRPTRPWVHHELAARFNHVYYTTTQPWHEEFPCDWTTSHGGLTRSVFVASQTELSVPTLTKEMPMHQARHQ